MRTSRGITQLAQACTRLASRSSMAPRLNAENILQICHWVLSNAWSCPNRAGLGLAIVKTIVDRHGAEIQVESKLGEGTRFEVSFPVKED